MLANPDLDQCSQYYYSRSNVQNNGRKSKSFQCLIIKEYFLNGYSLVEIGVSRNGFFIPSAPPLFLVDSLK
jgi:hypothetical protein